jgi:hypothetical protein
MYKPKLGSFDECREKLNDLGLPYFKHTEKDDVVIFHFAKLEGYKAVAINILDGYAAAVFRIEGRATDLVQPSDEIVKLELKSVLLE